MTNNDPAAGPHFLENGAPSSYRFASTTRSYLGQLAVRAGISNDPWFSPGDRRVCQEAGLRLAKYKRLQRDFCELKRPVPLAYLDAVGMRRDVLETVVEIDQELFERAAGSANLRPTEFTLRFVPALHERYIFPPLPLVPTEEEAVAHAQAVLDAAGMPQAGGCVHFPGLKSIWLSVSRTPRTTWYQPTLIFRRKDVVFSRVISQPGFSMQECAH